MDGYFVPDDENPVQRGFKGVAITLTFEDAAELAGPAIELARSTSGESVEVEESDVGWGGSAEAVVLVLEWVALIGGVGTAVSGSWALARRHGVRLAELLQTLRNSPESPSRPDLSLGAAVYLCMADLHNWVGGEVDEIELIEARDLTDPRRLEQSFSGGGDPYLLLFDSPNGSWLYLITSQGVVVHRSASGPLPDNPFWHGRWSAVSNEESKYLDATVALYDQDADAREVFDQDDV